MKKLERQGSRSIWQVLWRVLLVGVILVVILSDIMGLKIGDHVSPALLLAGVGCLVLCASFGCRKHQRAKQTSWLRFWEMLMTGGILLSILSDVLGSRLGYYFFAGIAVVGFIGNETLRTRLDRRNPEDHQPRKGP